MDFSGVSVLVTGGTGSFGHAFVKEILTRFSPSRVVVFSRDEMKHWQMAQLYAGDDRLRFLSGDVRDRERLYRAIDGVDVVVHAAASKIVPAGEYNPFETAKTNVLGAMNVIDACIDLGVSKVVTLSTDKASAPINLYGATKLVSDKMFIAGNSYAGSKNTRFSVVRYGNVMGSRGSVIPFFLQQKLRGLPLSITDEKMTRFMISLEQGVQLVIDALEQMVGGEIFVKKIPSMNVMDVAEAVDPGGRREMVGIRPGEKMHEQMISEEDSVTTYDFGPFYKVLPSHFYWSTASDPARGGTKVDSGFVYSSGDNSEWMSVEALQHWIEDHQAVLQGQIS